MDGTKFRSFESLEPNRLPELIRRALRGALAGRASRIGVTAAVLGGAACAQGVRRMAGPHLAMNGHQARASVILRSCCER